MGLTFVESLACGPDGLEETVNFLVDRVSGYSLLPNAVWQSLGLQPTREERFVRTEGTVVGSNVSFCYMVLPQGEGYSPVVLGERGDDHALLGAVTLGLC